MVEEMIKRDGPAMAKYAVSASSAFVVDLSILWILIDYANVHYLVATVIGFVAATFIHFMFSRYVTFRGTDTSLEGSYFYFMVIATIALVAVTGLMALFVQVFRFHYVISRVAIATVVEIISFFMHKQISFRMVQNRST